MPGGHRGAVSRVVDLGLGAWLNQIAPRVLALVGSCPLARLFGVQACLQPVPSAPRDRASGGRRAGANGRRAEPPT